MMSDEQPRATHGSWRVHAACVGSDPARFTDPRPDSDDTRLAIATCRGCPVRQPCLTEALTHPAASDVGIWGATTPARRDQLRRRMKPAAADPIPPEAGLFETLHGELTDLTGRALIVQLPAPPKHLLLIDGHPTLRTDDLEQARNHILERLEDYQPRTLAPYRLTDHGELADPAGRITITRLPTAPHLLIVIDGQPHTRHYRLDHARRDALATLASNTAPDLRDPDRPTPPKLHPLAPPARQLGRR